VAEERDRVRQVEAAIVVRVGGVLAKECRPAEERPVDDPEDVGDLEVPSPSASPLRNPGSAPEFLPKRRLALVEW
jgi:hypothetical protein